jgi:hypothetical protein
MDGVITMRGSASHLRRDAGYAATHTQFEFVDQCRNGADLIDHVT